MDNEISLWSLSDMLGMHKTEPQMWSKWNKVAAGAQGAKWTMVRKDRDTGHWDTRAHCRGINQWRMDRSRRKWELPKKYTQRTGNSWQEDRCGHVSWIENESARTPGPGSRTQDSGLWTLDSGLWPVICDDSLSMSSVARKNKGLRSEVNPLGKGNLAGFTLPPGHLKDLTCFAAPITVHSQPAEERMNCERAIDFSCLGFVSLCVWGSPKSYSSAVDI